MRPCGPYVVNKMYVLLSREYITFLQAGLHVIFEAFVGMSFIPLTDEFSIFYGEDC